RSRPSAPPGSSRASRRRRSAKSCASKSASTASWRRLPMAGPANSATEPRLDGSLFADAPARDVRFSVAGRWIDCDNFPAEHPLHKVEFFHRQMNEEVDSLECSARNLSDFPLEDWGLRLNLARQCADEARHAAMFRRILQSRGGRVGQFPVLNFQYRI